MKLAHIIKSLAISGAIALAPSMSSAATITLEKDAASWFGSNGSAGVTITETTLRPGGLSTLAGGFALKGDLNGDTIKESFVAWCLDISKYISMPSLYTIVAAPFSFNDISARIANIERLFETGFSNLILTDDAQSAGFQLALWELTYEKDAFDLGSGNFKASNNTDAIEFGKKLLDGLTGPILQNYDLTFLESEGRVSQSLVTAKPTPRENPPPVPLPGAGLLLLGALGGLGMLGRRRRH